jgi:hypothetical protein
VRNRQSPRVEIYGSNIPSVVLTRQIIKIIAVRKFQAVGKESYYDADRNPASGFLAGETLSSVRTYFLLTPLGRVSKRFWPTHVIAKMTANGRGV